MTQDNKSNRSNEENEFDLIRGQIENDKEVVIILYTLTEYTEQKMQSVLRWVLQKYQKEELYNSMYSVLFEVVVNGTRANIKKLFFEEQGLDITNNQDYSEGMKLFKEKITKKMFLDYGDKTKLKGKEVRIKFEHSNSGIRVEVENNTEILPIEEERIRSKLREGLKHEDILSYYSANADSTEGEGIGLVLSLLLLKAENLDPSLFRIGTKDGVTFSRIEIPFTDGFVSKRNINNKPPI